MNDKYVIGLWSKTSKNNLKYCNGQVEINGITYKVLLFANTSKKTEKSPDFSILLSKV